MTVPIELMLFPTKSLMSILRLGSLASDGSDFRNRTGSSTMYRQNVEVYSHSPSYILVILLCICIIKANEHYQQDSRTFHHTVVSTCWQFSCLGLGQIFRNRTGCSTLFGHQVVLYYHSVA